MSEDDEKYTAQELMLGAFGVIALLLIALILLYGVAYIAGAGWHDGVTR